MPHGKIIKDFAEWCAFSSTRSGCPIKSKEDVYPLIRLPNYKEILKGDRISLDEFGKWHKCNTIAICNNDNRLQIGWAAKIINIYLKTRVYMAQEGREGLVEYIHPPIDNGLWKGIKQEYGNDRTVIDKTHIVSKIKDITNYNIYAKVIEGCQLIAQKRGCLLIEVEELWLGTTIKSQRNKSNKYKESNENFKLIPINLLNKAYQKVIHLQYAGNLPFKWRGIKIDREMIAITLEILNAENAKTLPQNCRNDVRNRTPDGLDRRIKTRRNNDLRTANIISDVLEDAGIVEIVKVKNLKATRLLPEWCWELRCP
jgi:hypothetical protein